MAIMKNHYKDSVPEITVERIKTAIESLGYSLKEEWSKENAAGTYSLRLSIDLPGIEIGSNGKGSTVEYARASAYGELCERLENQLFSKIKEFATEEKKYYIDERYMDLDDLLESDSSYMTFLKKALEIENLPVVLQKKILLDLYGADKMLMRPFYSWKKGDIEWVPWTLAERFYGSNGMSAGNTIEEAAVQSLSEICERCVQRHLLQHPAALPDIPLSVCGKYEEEWKMYQRLCDKGYKVLLKDCSLGGKYPVAGLVVFKPGKDCFGLKLGSHPDLEIAIERTFTEAFQGMDEEAFSSVNRVDFSNFQVDHMINIYNTFKTIYGKYPWQVLIEDPQMPFEGWNGSSGRKDNKSMFIDMVNIFIKEGYDVLIRQVSFLGIPACQILVPGLSEMLPVSSKVIRACNTRKYVGKILKRPDTLTENEKRIINRNARFWKYSVLENKMEVQYNLIGNLEFPGDKNGNGLLYLEMASYYSLGNFQAAADSLKSWMEKEERMGEIDAFHKAAFHYINIKASGCDTDAGENALTQIYGEEVMKQVSQIFGDPEKIIEKLYPKFDCPDCEHCNNYSDLCKQAEYREIIKKLWRRQESFGLDQRKFAAYLNQLREENARER